MYSRFNISIPRALLLYDSRAGVAVVGVVSSKIPMYFPCVRFGDVLHCKEVPESDDQEAAAMFV